MDRFFVNPRPKPQPKPKPKPMNFMEKVISIKHDESVVENPCLHRVAREWAARLDVSPGRESADRGLLATARQALQTSGEAPAGEVLSGREGLVFEAAARLARVTSSRAAGSLRRNGRP